MLISGFGTGPKKTLSANKSLMLRMQKEINVYPTLNTMKNYIMAALCLAGVLSFTSCNTGTNEQQERDPAATTALGVDADTTLTDDKREFLLFAANANMLQKDLGLVAAEKAQTDAARLYGQKMVDLYTQKQTEVRDLARRYNVTLTEKPTDEHLERVRKVRDTKPSDFDMAYWDEAIDAHNEAIKEYDDNIKDFEETTNKVFNLWARNTQLEKRAQMEEAMRFRLDHRDIMRKRSGI
jgi:putative membrane protein